MAIVETHPHAMAFSGKRERISFLGAPFDPLTSETVVDLLKASGPGVRFRYVVLVAFVMVTSLMVSYTRARAEALIGQCKVGFLERPERIVLIIIGFLLR